MCRGKPLIDEIPLGADNVFDRFNAATLLPLAERVFHLAPGATITVRGMLVYLAPFANVKPVSTNVTYEITRKADGAHGEHTSIAPRPAPANHLPATLHQPLP